MRDRKRTVLLLTFIVAAIGNRGVGQPPAVAWAASLGSFGGAARVNGSQIVIRSQSGPGNMGADSRGSVLVGSRLFRLSCSEIRAVEPRNPQAGAPREVVFWGQGMDVDGSYLLIAARDRGVATPCDSTRCEAPTTAADTAGFEILQRAPGPQAADCGASGVQIKPIDAGDFVGVEADIPDIEFPKVGVGGGSGPSSHLRILTYNTALLYAAAEYPSGAPSLPTCATSCDPFEIPPFPVPCGCPELTLWPNDHRFANVGDVKRAQEIGERIAATDQDIVALSEVFHPGARAALIQSLAVSGPYKHFVSLLRGHAPVEGLTLNDLVAMEAGEISSFLADILESAPDMLDYEAVPGASGLMLFSKYPFLPLQGASVVNDAACGDPECQLSGQSSGAPLQQPGYVAFDVFDECKLEDCWASEGVGLVKVDTPGQASYVAFTHLQADYYDKSKFHPETRAAQFDTIRDVILGAIPPAEVSSASIYLVGDLNVAGAPRTSDQTAENQEWHDVFDGASNQPNAASGFFACGNGVGGQPCQFGINGDAAMTDSWAFESSPTDRGVSNEDDGFRLDYLVHTPQRLCMQHAMVAWDLQADPHNNGGLTWLSDHLPLRGDIGTAASWCSPNDDAGAALPFRNLHDFQFGPTNCAAGGQGPPCHQDEIVSPPQAQIGPAGAFQWFRIEQPGTYSIDLNATLAGQNVQFAVYHHTDLSRPIAPFEEEEGDLGIVYGMPEPPYYLRVFAIDTNGEPDRLASNRPYALKVHQHLCRTPQDACVLDPGLALDAPYSYQWPTAADPLSDVRELYWRFKASGVRGGRLRAGTDAGISFPRVRMQMEGSSVSYGCITQTPPVLERWNDHLFPTLPEEQIAFTATEIDPDDHDAEDDGLIDDLRVAPDLPGKQDDAFQVYFLKVTRSSNWLDGFNPCNDGVTSYVSYHSDLTYIVPRKLLMWAELDDDLGAEDNLWVRMGFDEGGFAPAPPVTESAKISLEQPDSGFASVDLHGHSILRGYFVDQVWPTLWEIDEGELLYPWQPYAPFGGLPSLSSWLVSAPLKGTSDVPFETYADDGNADDADYYYYLYYKVCHLATEPVCANP